MGCFGGRKRVLVYNPPPTTKHTHRGPRNAHALQTHPSCPLSLSVTNSDGSTGAPPPPLRPLPCSKAAADPRPV